MNVYVSVRVLKDILHCNCHKSVRHVNTYSLTWIRTYCTSNSLTLMKLRDCKPLGKLVHRNRYSLISGLPENRNDCDIKFGTSWSIPYPPTCLIFQIHINIIFHLHLGLTKDLFPSGFKLKLSICLSQSACANACLIMLNLISFIPTM
jgi:hypothetical protein